MAPLRLLSTLGVAGVMQALAPRFERAEGLSLDSTFLPTLSLMERIRASEPVDVAILTGDAMDELDASGLLQPGTRADLARSFVGIAVRAGAVRPDIGTVEAFVATMLAAPSVALSRAGASGIFFAGLLQRLGIADAVMAKATVIPSGFTAELLVQGEAALAVQQVSELMVVPGVDIVGRLPTGIEGVTLFAAAVFAGSAHPAAAALVRFLADPAHGPLLRACGLEPASPAAP